MRKPKAREVQKFKISNLNSRLKRGEVKNTILDFDGYGCIDIGALCFLDRTALKRGRFPVKGRTVNSGSIDKSRIDCLYKYIISISTKLDIDSGALHEIYKNTIELVRYVEWCDFRGHENTLANGRCSSKNIEEYSSFQSMSGNKSQVSKNQVKNRILSALSYIWTFDELGLRAVKKYDPTLSIEQIIARPWEAIVGFGTRRSADIGSLCYQHGDSLDSRLPNSGRNVDINSFNPSRVDAIIKLIKLISNSVLKKEKNLKTLHLEITEFMRFIIWCDDNRMFDVFSGVEEAGRCLILYEKYLSGLISNGGIQRSRALVREKATVLWLSRIFDATEFERCLSNEELTMQEDLERVASGKLSKTYLSDFLTHSLEKFTTTQDGNFEPGEIQSRVNLKYFHKHLIKTFYKAWLKNREFPKKLKAFFVFLRWSERSGYLLIFDGQTYVKAALESFEIYLDQQVQTNQIRTATKNQRLKAITQLMGEAYQIGCCHLQPIVVIDLMEDGKSFKLDHPERVALKFSDAKILNVGYRCYMSRSKGLGSKYGSTWIIDYESINSERVAQIKKLIQLIAKEFNHSGRRPETIHDLVKRYMSMLDWADENQHGNLMVDIDSAKSAAREYVRFIRQRVSLGEITIASGARQQWASLSLLGIYFGDDKFKRGLNLLYADPASKQSTRPIDQGSLQRVVTLSDYLFNGFCDVVLGGAKYPHKIRMPEYLGWQTSEIYIFPAAPMFLTPLQLENRDKLSRPGWPQNYKEGRLSSAKELMAFGAYSCNKSRIDKALKRAQASLTYANKNIKNSFNFKIAIRSVYIFLILFLAETGMNWSQAINQEWDGEYDESIDIKGFRGIKPRAGNREVCFYLSVEFMPTFRRYIKLRKYLLSGKSYKYLFFDFGVDIGAKRPQKIKQIIDFTFDFMRRIDPDLPMIKSRQLRATKSDYLLRNTDIDTTAIILQNSVNTVLASYAEGQETSQVQEITKYLNGLSNSLLIVRGQTSVITELPIGACIANGNPSGNINGQDVSPDCKRIEGCFFCDKYRVHTDEKDVRKLASCRLFLRKVSNSFGSYEEFHTASDSYLMKIEEILSSISKINPDVVEIVSNEVELEGELDSYWQKKLEMFMELSA